MRGLVVVSYILKFLVCVFVCLDVPNMGIYPTRDKRDFLLLQLSCIKLNYVR